MDPASAAGLALSVASLSFQVFAGCVKGFVLVSTAHNFGKDASFLRTMLNVEEYRFVQWADAVGLTASAAKMLPQINQTLAEELMVQLSHRLDCSKLKERYSLDLQPAGSTSRTTDNDSSSASTLQGPDILAKTVSDERRTEILSQAKLIQHRTGLPKRLWWAALEKSRFQDLVRDLRQIVDALWNLLEPVRLRELSQQVSRTLTAVVDMSHDLDALKGLQASLSPKTGGFPGEAILTAAVRLKVVRAQLPGENSTIHRIPPPTDNPLRPLNRSLLQRPADKQSATSGAFIATYDGKPVLCEAKRVYAPLKPKLRVRSENLARLLSQPKSPGFFTLQCLGFLEDMDEFIFLYDYPPDTDTSLPPRSLHDLLRDSKLRPPSVTTRLQLAHTICSTLLTVHTAGWLHKNIRSENILFFTPASATMTTPLTTPYLTGFTFSRADFSIEISDQASDDPLLDIYRHPAALGEPVASYAMYMDHYSLGTVLTEIAEWRALKHIVRKYVDVTQSEVDVPLTVLAGIQGWLVRELMERGQVAFRMGEVYGEGVSWLVRLEHGDAEGGNNRNKSGSGSTEQLLAFQQFVDELSSCRV